MPSDAIDPKEAGIVLGWLEYDEKFANIMLRF